MNFRIHTHDFTQAVQRVQGVVDKKHTIPILGNILLVVEDATTVHVGATNLELGIRTQVPILDGEPGSLTLPAGTLAELARELPDGEVSLVEEENAWARLTCHDFTTRIAGLPQGDFPELPSFSITSAFQLDSDLLKRAITTTNFAISRDESRYALTGAHVLMTDTGIQLTATDGHRLSQFQSTGVMSGEGVIVPLKAMTEVKKLCDAAPVIMVAIEEQQILFQGGDTILSSRLINGQFPDYSQVIPDRSLCACIEVAKDPFVAALRRVLLLGGDSRQVVFAFADQTLTLSATDPNIGTATESVSCTWHNDPLTLGFNGRYLLDALAVCEGETVTMAVRGPLDPGLWYADAQAQHVMPMRVSEGGV